MLKVTGLEELSFVGIATSVRRYGERKGDRSHHQASGDFLAEAIIRKEWKLGKTLAPNNVSGASLTHLLYKLCKFNG